MIKMHKDLIQTEYSNLTNESLSHAKHYFKYSAQVEHTSKTATNLA